MPALGVGHSHVFFLVHALGIGGQILGDRPGRVLVSFQCGRTSVSFLQKNGDVIQESIETAILIRKMIPRKMRKR